jgi:hypothetical protein
VCVCSSPASLQFFIGANQGPWPPWKDGFSFWLDGSSDAKVLTQQTNLECQDCFWWIFAEVPTKKSGNWLPKSIVHRPFRCCLATRLTLYNRERRLETIRILWNIHFLTWCTTHFWCQTDQSWKNTFFVWRSNTATQTPKRSALSQLVSATSGLASDAQDLRP